MPTSTHKMILPGTMIQRGFWLYVCRIDSHKGELLYVGRTGDESSANAAAPFARLGQHLAIGGKANAILRHLEKADVSPEQCTGMEMVACGPLFCETKAWEEHKKPRDKVAALEKKLADTLRDVGYVVLNEVNCKRELDDAIWDDVCKAFAEHFPKLQ